jgi:hypothetical protein
MNRQRKKNDNGEIITAAARSGNQKSAKKQSKASTKVRGARAQKCYLLLCLLLSEATYYSDNK